MRAKHKWHAVDYAHGNCMTSPWTLEEFHTMQYALRSTTGIDMDPIAPDQVTKDDKGAIHVHEPGSGPNGALDFNFFTSKDQCDHFIRTRASLHSKRLTATSTKPRHSTASGRLAGRPFILGVSREFHCSRLLD